MPRTWQVESAPTKSILTKPSGFADQFDYTLNPYSGCTFGCQYCYAAFFAPTEVLKDSWGKWVRVKETALELLKKKRKKPLIDKSIYISTVTDPYQPIERELRLTRTLLEELLDYHQVRVVIQTRSPLVTRDIDLLRQFDFVQVNMTVTTDDETVRRAFEPTCPSIAQRLNAIQQVHEAGIQTAITMTPLLPIRSPEILAERLLATGATRFAIQHFHPAKSRFVASTGDAAITLSKQMGWDNARYQQVFAILNMHLPNLREGKAGFTPYWVNEPINSGVLSVPQ